MKLYAIISSSNGVDLAAYGHENTARHMEVEFGMTTDHTLRLGDMPEDTGPHFREALPKYNDNTLVILRRAVARRLARALNNHADFGSAYRWRVVEVGEDVQRDRRPVLGWRVMVRQADGRTFESFANDMEGEVLLDNGNRLFETRAQARASAKALNNPEMGLRYFVEPVYGAYTWDDGTFVGSFKFRTEEDAMHPNVQRSLSCGMPSWKPRLHKVEVDESELEDVTAARWASP